MNVAKICVIPRPVKLSQEQGFFELNANTQIIANKDLMEITSRFFNGLSKATGFVPKTSLLKMPVVEDYPFNTIIVSYTNESDDIPNEGYILSVKQKSISLKGRDNPGVFYGLQTLRQLLPIDIESSILIESKNWQIPCVEIKDYPRFSWRGFMLDEVRHFFGKTFVMRMIDLMALHKLNKLHWHLTDDEGWRIESKKYPKLTNVASSRPLSKKWGETMNSDDPNTYAGYYSQDEIKEIIEFAQQHFIEIIPEIEMPGHATAPLVAYPEFSCEKPPKVVPFIGQGNRHSYCPGKHGTYEFLKNILDEITSIFVSDKIHIGGDELPKERWKNCPDCAKYRNDLHLKDLDEQQVRFAAEIIKYLQFKGKTAIGWFDFPVDRLLDQQVDNKKLLFQFWVGSESKVISFIEKGGNAVISNHRYCYMDYTYNGISLKKAYTYDPIPKGLDEKYHSQVLGMENPIWCERVPNIQKMDFQIFPRLTAYAETGWTPKENKDYKDFMERLKCLLQRLDQFCIYYAPLFEAENSLKAKLIPGSLRRKGIANLMSKRPV